MKKNKIDLAEAIDAMGQEDEKQGAKWVIEKGKEEEKQNDETDARDITILTDKRKYKKNTYFEALLAMARRKLAEYDLDREYRVDVFLRDNKLIFGLCRVGYKWYAKGMIICGTPQYDMNCVERLVIQVMICVDELAIQHEKGKTASGIYLPPKL